MKIKFEFRRNEDHFCLLPHDANTKFVIDLEDVRMSYKRYNPSNMVQKWFDNKLRTKKVVTLPIDIFFL